MCLWHQHDINIYLGKQCSWCGNGKRDFYFLDTSNLTLMTRSDVLLHILMKMGPIKSFSNSLEHSMNSSVCKLFMCFVENLQAFVCIQNYSLWHFVLSPSVHQFILYKELK